MCSNIMTKILPNTLLKIPVFDRVFMFLKFPALSCRTIFILKLSSLTVQRFLGHIL